MRKDWAQERGCGKQTAWKTVEGERVREGRGGERRGEEGRGGEGRGGEREERGGEGREREGGEGGRGGGRERVRRLTQRPGSVGVANGTVRVLCDNQTLTSLGMHPKFSRKCLLLSRA